MLALAAIGCARAPTIALRDDRIEHGGAADRESRSDRQHFADRPAFY
jgi:hypothetical protein